MNFFPSRPVLLFAHPSMDELAKAIVLSCEASRNDHTRQLTPCTSETELKKDGSVDTDFPHSYHVRREVRYLSSGIKWGKFQDGFPNLFIDNVKGVAGRDVIFVASFHTPEVIFEQLSVIYAIPRYLAKSFTLILPYFPTGTMERVDTEGQIATANTLAQLLSSIPLTARGPAQIVIFDIHALQERFYFCDTVIPRLESAVSLLKAELSLLADGHPVAIAFPDDGAFKRFHLMFKDVSKLLVCNKVRENDKRVVKLKEGDPTGCHVVIVDDLVQTGGTLIESAKVLLKSGAKCVSAYVTHAVFPNNSWKKFVSSEVPFQNFWITDSIPHALEISRHRPFRLLSLGSVIANALLSYDLRNI